MLKSLAHRCLSLLQTWGGAGNITTMTEEVRTSRARADAVAAVEEADRKQRQSRRDALRSSADFCLAGATIVFGLSTVGSIVWILASVVPQLGNTNATTRSLPVIDLLVAGATLGISLFLAGAAKWLRSRPHS